MTTYVDSFGSATVPPAESAYAAYTISANSQLVWPAFYGGQDLLLATKMEITASAPGLVLALPPADQVSTGEDFFIRNAGAESFDVVDYASGAVTTVLSGETRYLFVTSNATPAGVWGLFTLGTGTSGADASLLAGEGLEANSNRLRVNAMYRSINSNSSATLSDRGKVLEIVAGTVTLELPQASAAGDGFYLFVRNSAGGSTVVEGYGSEQVDGALQKTLAPNESAIFICNGTYWITVGFGRDATFVFSEVVVNSALTSITLTSADVAGRMIRVSGTAVGNVTITLPSIDNIYFVNVEAGVGGFTVTFETSGGGSTVVMTASQSTALYCDGTNVTTAISTTLISALALADGSAGVPSLRFSLDPDTGIFRPGSGDIGFASNGTEAARLGLNGSVQRFGGNWSAADPAARLLLQTTVTNGDTYVSAVPNGAGTVAGFAAFGGATPTNSSTALFSVGPTTVNVEATRAGAGSYLPLTSWTNGVRRTTVTVGGDYGVGADTPNYFGGSRAVTVQGSAAAAFEVSTTAADASGVTIGNLGFWFQSNAVNHRNVASVEALAVGGTATQRGGVLTFKIKPNGITSLLETMRLNSSGLGLGTNSPNYGGYSYAFTVEGTTSAAAEIASTRADADAANIGAVEWNYRTASASHQRIASVAVNTDGATANQRGGAIVFNTKPNASTTLGEKARITAAGDFGVGTSTPNYTGYSRAVTVQGTSQAVFEVASTRADGDALAIGGLEWNYRTASAGHQRAGLINVETQGATANQRGSRMVFHTKPNASSTLTERMTINNVGDIGIGTSTPNYAGFGKALTLEGPTGTGVEVASSQADASGLFIGSVEANYRTNSASHQRIGYMTFRTTGATVNQRGGQIEFATKANGSTALTVRMTIADGGTVNIPGYTVLGDSSPPIKMKKITGTAPAVSGSTSVAHGIDVTKLISCNVQVTDTGGNRVPPNDSIYGNRTFMWRVDATNVTVSLNASASLVAGQPFTALLIYEA